MSTSTVILQYFHRNTAVLLPKVLCLFNNKVAKIRKDIAPSKFPLSHYPFEKVWTLYDKPVGNQTKLRSMWNALAEEERKQCFEYIGNYVQVRTRQYRKNFENFITLRTWLNEPLQFERNGTHIEDITTHEDKRDTANAAIGAMQRLLAANQPVCED